MVPRPLAPVQAMRSRTCAHVFQPCRVGLRCSPLALVVQREPARRLSLNKFLKCYESLLAFEKTNVNSFIDTQKHILTPTTHSNTDTENTKDKIFSAFPTEVLSFLQPRSQDLSSYRPLGTRLSFLHNVV